MKKLTLLLFTVILSLLSFHTFANDLSYTLTVKKSIIKIDFESFTTTEDHVELEVLSLDGEQLLSHKLSVVAKANTEFDVSSLEKGSYQFRMKFENRILQKEFKLSKSKRISMRGYILKQHDRGLVIEMNGKNFKIQTTNRLKGNIDLTFTSLDGSEKLLYEGTFLSGINAITNIDLTKLGASHFKMSYKEQGITYTERFLMY